MADDTLAHNADFMLTQESQMSQYIDNLQTTHITIDHTRKRNKVGPSDGHISTTKKDNKILWRKSLALLS